MKVVASSVLVLLTLVLFSTRSTVGEVRSQAPWGQASNGVQLSLTSTHPSDLQLAFRNVSDRDVMLNLGYMLGNGKVQLPDHISLKLIDASGSAKLFKFADKKHAFIAGRVDDYVVPLRVGSTYTVTLRLDQFWCKETSEFEITLLPGKNTLTAEFAGTGANFINLDMPGIKLMNFWLGHVESNTLTIER